MDRETTTLAICLKIRWYYLVDIGKGLGPTMYYNLNLRLASGQFLTAKVRVHAQELDIQQLFIINH